MATLNYVLVTPAAIADNAIVSGVAGQRVRVVSFIMSASGGGNTATWKSATTAISPAIVMAANEKVIVSGAPRDVYLFQTAAGAALNLALTAATAVGVSLTYIQTDADN